MSRKDNTDDAVEETIERIEKGQEIVWNGRTYGARVVYVSDRFSTRLTVRGPRGGEYVISTYKGATVARDEAIISSERELVDEEPVESIEIVAEPHEVEPPVEVGAEYKQEETLDCVDYTGEYFGYRVEAIDREAQRVTIAIPHVPESTGGTGWGQEISLSYEDVEGRLERGWTEVEDLEEDPDAAPNRDPETGEVLEDGESEIVTDGGDGEEVSEVDGGVWEPETAELRDGEAPDLSSHARRNEAMIAKLEELEDEDDDGPAVVTDGGEPLRSRLRPGDGIRLEIGGLLIVVGVGETSDGAPVYEVSAPKRSSTMLYRPHNFRAALEAGAEIVLDAAPVVSVEPFECPVCGRLAFDRDARERTDGGIRVCSYGCVRRSWTLSGREELEDAVEDDDGPEIVTDGGWITIPETEWCSVCQRERVSCSHLEDR